MTCTNTDGDNADPATLNLLLRAPDGTETTIAIGSMTKSAVGIYYYDYRPLSAGKWTYREETNTSADQDVTFVIASTIFYPTGEIT